MIWNLDINDPNIPFLLQKEKEALHKQIQQKQLFQQAISQIEDQQIQQLIQQNVNLILDSNKLKTFKQQLQFCVQIQTFFQQGNQYIQNDNIEQIIEFFIQLSILIETHIDIINQDQNIQEFINNNKKQFCLQITEKYEEKIIKQLQEIGFPDPNDMTVQQNNDIIQQLIPYSRLTKQIIQFQPKFLQKIFTKMNQHFDYHFIDNIQYTSDIEKPNWLFNYLYDQFEDSIKQLFKLDQNYLQEIQSYSNYELEEIAKIYAHLMIENYILKNIHKRLIRDKEDFIARPNLALTFIEELYNFCEKIEQFWFECFDQQFDTLYESIVVYINEIDVFPKILELEVTLFSQSIFDEYEKKLLEKNIHQFLNLVEEFQIVWNSEHYKYSKLIHQGLKQQVTDFFQLIFKNFLDLCSLYFYIIESIQEKDYIQFLQTYYIGLKTLKQKFSNYSSLIKRLQQSTLGKFLQSTANKCAEDIFQKLLKNYLFDDKQFSEFISTVIGTTKYENQQIFFIQSQHEFSKKLNNFFSQANIIINQMINENIIQKQYTNQLAAKIVSMTIKQLQDKVQKFVNKYEFSQEGALLFFLNILRTVYLVLYQAINMGNTKQTQKLIEKYKQLEIILQNRYMLNDQQNLKKSSLISKDELDFIKKMKICQMN